MGGILWEYKNYFNIEGIDCLSRFCLKAEGRRKISILRSACKHIALKNNQNSEESFNKLFSFEIFDRINFLKLCPIVGLKAN